MVLLSIVGIGVVTMFVLQARKLQENTKSRDQAEIDIDRAVAMMTTIFVTPANCNANLKGLPVAQSELTEISKCGSVNCGLGGGLKVLNINNWEMFPGEANAKAKINHVKLSIAPQGQHNPGVVTLSFNFTKNVGYANGNMITAISRDFEVQAFVNNATYNGPGSITPTPNINGCTRSPSSTEIY